LRVLVDRSSLELFIDGGNLCMAFCFTPSAEDRGLELFVEGAPLQLISLKLHPLRSSWEKVEF